MAELDFLQRPIDISSDLRLYRRLAMLVISLSECCRGNTGSLRQLHFINSFYLDDKFQELYLTFREGYLPLKILSPSADPYLNRCINYALGAEIIEQKKIQNGYRLILTKKGEVFLENLKELELANDLFALSRTLGKLSDTDINKVVNIEG